MQDIKDLIGTLMRALASDEITENEIIDLDFEADGQLRPALNDAYIKLLEFVHDRDLRRTDRNLDRKERAALQDSLNKIVDLCIPVYGQEGGTMVIPGHGRLSDVGDVINAREMVTIVRDRVQDMVKKNMTLDQVKAAKPTKDYDTVYNTQGAFVTADAFVEAVYRSLKK